jgi:hypothetical protein
MGNVLLVTGTVAVLFVVGVITMMWAAWRAVRHRNEVSASHPVRPPLRWMFSPETCGRLHRRLRDAVLVLRRAVPARRVRRRRERTMIEAWAAEVEAHAVLLDLELVRIARLRGPHGSALRTKAAADIAELERTAHRLAATSVRSALHANEPTEVTLRHISEVLDAREAAWNEVQAVERAAGLHQPI